MSCPPKRGLFATAYRSGSFTSFCTSIEERIAEAQASNAAAARVSEEDAREPERDLSRVRGTPEQIRQVEALRDEISRLHKEAARKMLKGTHMVADGFQLRGSGNASSLIGCSGEMTDRVYEGHGTWVSNSSQAEGSAMYIEGQMCMGEASKIERVITARRISLLDLKKRITPVRMF